MGLYNTLDILTPSCIDYEVSSWPPIQLAVLVLFGLDLLRVSKYMDAFFLH